MNRITNIDPSVFAITGRHSTKTPGLMATGMVETRH